MERMLRQDDDVDGRLARYVVETSSRQRADPSGPSFGVDPSKTHSLRTGADDFSGAHNLLGHVN